MGRKKQISTAPKTIGYGGGSNTFGGNRHEVRDKKNGRFTRSVPGRSQSSPESLSPSEVTPIESQVEGARLIDLHHLQQQLVCRNQNCCAELSIRAIIDETHLGLASVLTLACNNCGRKNKVQTSKLNPNGSYNVNIAAVLGAHDAGIGNTQMRAFLSTMNSPSMTMKSFEAIERRIGPNSVDLAEKSCEDAILQEKELSMLRKEIIICEFCKIRSYSKVEAEKHIEEHLERLSLLQDLEVCGICLNQVSRAEFENHIKTHCSDLSEPCSCLFCSKPFARVENMVRHMKNAHLISFSENEKMEKVKAVIDIDKNNNDESAPIGITGSSDGCWLKRGNGYSYDSHSGFVSIMGQDSGKVLSYRVKQNYCRKCASLGRSCKDKLCCKNWTGSSKSMEAGSVVEMVANNPRLSDLGVKFDQLVCDGDSSVGAGVRQATQGSCQRVADVTHTLKHLSNHLFGFKSKQLNATVIDYLKRMAAIAIKSNKNNAPDMVNALLSIPHHVFGMHSKCNEEWCNKTSATQSSWSKHLDGPIDVEGSSTFQANFRAVQNEFEKLASKAAELAPNGSTQRNESLNAIITSKAPKRVDFSSSRAVVYRCAAGVLQKNIGVAYTTRLREANKISPGRFTASYKLQLALERRKTSLKRISPVYKRRRRVLLFARKNKKNSLEQKEGPTYKTGLHLQPSATSSQPKQRVKNYVPPPLRQQANCLTLEQLSDPLVFFDIETSGLAVGKSEIIQLSAKCDESTFNVFVKPKYGIRQQITDLTGISVSRGKMYHKDRQIEFKHNVQEALVEFLNYLKNIGPRKIILVAHNARFDLSFLHHSLEVNGLIDNFDGICSGFVDTLSMARKMLPISSAGPENHKISGLLKFFYGDVSVVLHDSANDCLALESIFLCMTDEMEDIIEHSYNFADFQRFQKAVSRAKRMSRLRDYGFTSPMLTKLSTVLSYQGLVALSKEGYDRFRDELAKVAGLTQNQISATFAFATGRSSSE